MYVHQAASVVQSKGAHAQKPELSTIEHGHQMDGDHYILSFAGALRFLQCQVLCRLNKSPSAETIN